MGFGKLKVAVAVWDPWCTTCAAEVGTLNRKPGCNKPGICNEILGYILEYLKVDYELFLFPNFVDWGEPPINGSRYWSGLLGGLQNGTYDVISSGYGIFSSYQQTFLYTHPIMYTKHAILYSTGFTSYGDVMALFNVFTKELWLTILAACFVIALLFALNDMIFSQRRSKREQVSEGIWTVIGFLVDQCSSLLEGFPTDTVTAHVLLMSIGMTALFFSNLYGSSLVSLLVKSNTVFPFKGTLTLAKRIEAGDFKLIVEPGTELGFNDSSFRALSTALLRSPIQLEPNRSKIVERLQAKERLAYIIDGPVANQIIADNCGLKYVKDEDRGSVRAAFVFRQNQSDLVEQFNHVIDSHIKFIMYINNRYKLTPKGQCENEIFAPALTILNFSYPMICLVTAGTTLGLLALVSELFCKKILKFQHHKNELSDSGVTESQLDGNTGTLRHGQIKHHPAMGVKNYMDSLQQEQSMVKRMHGGEGNVKVRKSDDMVAAEINPIKEIFFEPKTTVGTCKPIGERKKSESEHQNHHHSLSGTERSAVIDQVFLSTRSMLRTIGLLTEALGRNTPMPPRNFRANDSKASPTLQGHSDNFEQPVQQLPTQFPDLEFEENRNVGVACEAAINACKQMEDMLKTHFQFVAMD